MRLVLEGKSEFLVAVLLTLLSLFNSSSIDRT